jgi:hypothetical protein
VRLVVVYIYRIIKAASTIQPISRTVPPPRHTPRQSSCFTLVEKPIFHPIRCNVPNDCAALHLDPQEAEGMGVCEHPIIESTGLDPTYKRVARQNPPEYLATTLLATSPPLTRIPAMLKAVCRTVGIPVSRGLKNQKKKVAQEQVMIASGESLPSFALRKYQAYHRIFHHRKGSRGNKMLLTRRKCIC